MDRHPIQQAALRERVVFGGAVLGTAVLPHGAVALRLGGRRKRPPC